LLLCYCVLLKVTCTKKQYNYYQVKTVNLFTGFVVDKIFKDTEFRKTRIEPQVTKFFMESLLPEVIDSRFDRGLPIRSGLAEPQLYFIFCGVKQCILLSIITILYFYPELKLIFGHIVLFVLNFIHFTLIFHCCNLLVLFLSPLKNTLA